MSLSVITKYVNLYPLLSHPTVWFSSCLTRYLNNSLGKVGNHHFSSTTPAYNVNDMNGHIYHSLTSRSLVLQYNLPDRSGRIWLNNYLQNYYHHRRHWACEYRHWRLRWWIGWYLLKYCPFARSQYHLHWSFFYYYHYDWIVSSPHDLQQYPLHRHYVTEILANPWNLVIPRSIVGCK